MLPRNFLILAAPIIGGLLAILPATSEAQILTDDKGCQLVVLLPFSDKREGPPEAIQDEGVEYYGYGVWPDKATLEQASFSLMLTAEMAVNHFNNRDSSIVPELAELETCDIKIPPVLYRDSAFSRPTAVSAVVNITRSAADPAKALCAVIGPTDSRANEGVSAITENLGIPQIAYSTIDRRLSRREDFPTLARTITSSQDFGFAIANFVQRDVLKRDFLAVIYDISNEEYEDPLEDAEDFLGYSTITEHIIEGDRESIEDALGTTVEDGMHTILLASNRVAVLDDVAEVAEEKGLLGEEYFWILPGDMLTPATMPTLSYEVDSPTDKLLRGAAVFTNYDPFVYYGESDPFLRAWRKQDNNMAALLNIMNPLKKTIMSDMSGYFQSKTPTQYASFLYDSIVLAGISACKANSVDRGHVAEVFETRFKGASGYVEFSQSEKTSELVSGRLNGRDISGVVYGMYNVRRAKVEDNMASYELVLTHLYTNDTQVEDPEMPVTGSWIPVEGTEFLFFDGTPNPPMPLKTTADFNYISNSVQIVGLFLASFAFFVACASGIWVYVMREDRIVRASQPEFLYLLCIGSGMVAASLFFISWDEGKGVSADQLSALCSVFPWLFVIGYQVMYMALFFKLWRLSKLLSMRRQAIKINQVLLPFALIVFLSIIILMVWQIVDPLIWHREILNPDAEEQYISYGECGSDFVLPFMIPLGFIISASVLMTGAISWKLKDVQAELAETKWIFFGIFSHIQIWAIGIPLFIILDDVSRDASYLISVALSFIFSASLVVLVIWPKIYIWARDKYFGGPPKPSMSTVSVGKRQTVVSGLDTNSTVVSTTSVRGVAADTRRVHELEKEIKEMEEKHERELAQLNSLVNDLQAKQSGTIAEAEVEPLNDYRTSISGRLEEIVPGTGLSDSA